MRGEVMSRLADLRNARPGLFARLVYMLTRRKLGRVPEPVKILNANGALLAGVGAMETAFERARCVPARLKSLAELRVALMVGCPF